MCRDIQFQLEGFRGMRRWATNMIAVLVAGHLGLAKAAQDSPEPEALARNRYRSGEEILRAFEPLSQATRWSIVKFNLDGKTIALGTVMDTNGLVLTKASEVAGKQGKLTCWLASEQEVDAQVLSADTDEDVALIQVRARGLKPIQWSTNTVTRGQWAVTPGIASTPQAVGIVSALPRRIRPPRAFIGVQFDFNTSIPKIEALMPNLGAEKAGLKPGDTIVALNNTLVTNREQIIETLREFRAGQTVKLRIRRAEDQFDADIQLMNPRPEDGDFGGSRPRRFSRLSGELSGRSEGFEQVIEHDTVLQPWLCGGPLLDLQGQAVGLNIARASRVTTFALSANLVQRIFKDLKSSSDNPPGSNP